jgi:hypothetical protein
MTGADKRAPPGMGNIPMSAEEKARKEFCLIRRLRTRISIRPEKSKTPPIKGIIPTDNARKRIEESPRVFSISLNISEADRLNDPKSMAEIMRASQKFFRDNIMRTKMERKKPSQIISMVISSFWCHE